MFRTEHALRERIAGEVRAEMARQRITATALSATVGIPSATLSRKLSGKSGLTVDELFDIAQALKVSPTKLLALTPEQASA